MTRCWTACSTLQLWGLRQVALHLESAVLLVQGWPGIAGWDSFRGGCSSLTLANKPGAALHMMLTPSPP